MTALSLPHTDWPSELPPALRFDDFALTPRQRALTHRGDAVKIGARAFDLLTLLASRAGEIVPHAALIQAAWPRRVVSDCNLKVQIAALQKTLGHARSGGRYIESVAMRGYVFVGAVRAQPGRHLGVTDARRADDAATRLGAFDTPLRTPRVSGWAWAQVVARLQAPC